MKSTISLLLVLASLGAVASTTTGRTTREVLAGAAGAGAGYVIAEETDDSDD
jgi:outer membrane lipoprotein SlyB